MAKTWKRPVAALLLCALLAGAGSLAAAPYAGESGELTPQERARRANVPEGPWIWIDIPQKSLTLYEGTEVKKRYAVATGTGDTPSPIGTFRVTSRFAGDLGGFGTRFLGLNVPWGQFGIHGTNKPGSIGSNASHGCIRMYVRDSEELYGLVPNGAKVVIQGGLTGSWTAICATSSLATATATWPPCSAGSRCWAITRARPTASMAGARRRRSPAHGRIWACPPSMPWTRRFTGPSA